MRWIVCLTALLVFGAGARAAGPDDQFVDIYNQIVQAESMETAGQAPAAAQKFHDAQTALQQLNAEHPGWNHDVVQYRLEYLADKLAALGKYLPATNAPPPAPAAPPAATPQQQIAALREQIGALSALNGQLQQQLKEALSVQPAAVSPAELAKAQEKIAALQKENELLNVTLKQQAAAAPAAAPPPAASDDATKLKQDLAAALDQAGKLRESNAQAEEKLKAASDQLAALQAAPPQTGASADVQQLTAERDRLKTELEQRTRDLADAEAHHADAKEQPAIAAAPAPDVSSAQIEQLRARLAVLEATAVPYTAEELAALKKAPATPPAAAAPPPVAPKRIAHSMLDLPPGAGPLMAEASRAAMERDFKGAVEKYEQILIQDENNVYVLAHLANAQFAGGDLEGCEKSVTRALALDPGDPASLYLLGVLRYRQEKLDEALDALSRSAQANPTNSGTQNYLGCVLADKGLRPAAETAFRKALQLDPDYGDAHYNLAFAYATEKPPSPELARWHYKRALDLGHAKSDELEKLLGAAP